MSTCPPFPNYRPDGLDDLALMTVETDQTLDLPDFRGPEMLVGSRNCRIRVLRRLQLRLGAAAIVTRRCDGRRPYTAGSSREAERRAELPLEVLRICPGHVGGIAIDAVAVPKVR